MAGVLLEHPQHGRHNFLADESKVEQIKLNGWAEVKPEPAPKPVLPKPKHR